MVGSIVLPIMLSVGVQPVVAANAYLAAMTAGYVINPANISAITNITGVAASSMYLCAAILSVMSILFAIGYLVFSFRKGGKKFAFATPIETTDEEERPQQVTGIRGFLACMTPPLLLLR